MSIIDWSDPAEMLGLLIDYVADEAIGSHDTDRSHFLKQLSRELGAVADQSIESADAIALTLREIRDSQRSEFAGDAVMAHLEACIEEIHRINAAQNCDGL